MSSEREILLVEDNRDWTAQFREALRAVGESRAVQSVDLDEFLQRFKLSSDFDRFDFAFVDIELQDNPEEQKDATEGITVILPKIRELAPWLPCAALSKYLDIEGVVLDASLNGFDALIPKSIIRRNRTTLHSEFSLGRWVGILNGAKIRRLSCLIGRGVHEITRSGHLEATERESYLMIADEVRTTLPDVALKSLVEALGNFGFGGSQLVVQRAISGFSGMFVNELCATGIDEYGAVEGSWLLKWGSPASKLFREIEAHKRQLRRGVNRRILPTLYFSNVFSVDGYAFLAYQFEKEARTGLDVIVGGGLVEMANALLDLGNKFWVDPHLKAIRVGEEVARWAGLPVREQAEWGICPVKEIAKASVCLVHGDFHLRNLLFNAGGMTLIDFARSDTGPLVVDVAKILADMVAFVPECRMQVRAPEQLLEGEGHLGSVVSVFQRKLKAEHDQELLKQFFRGFLAKYVGYEDVSADARQYILGLFGRV